MSRVVVIGSINVDLVVSADRLPRPGETVVGGRFARHLGGKGANQAVAAARAGATVTMVGAVGRDPDGDESLSALSAEGIDVSRVRRTDAPTGVAIIAVAADGENQIVVAPGANAEVSIEDAALNDLPRGPGVMLTCLEIPMPSVLAAVAAATRIGLQSVVNPAPAQRLPAALLAAGPILTPNRGELLALSGAADAEAGLAFLTDAGARAVVMTLGTEGALLADSTRRAAFPAWQVAVVDATGAGDTFSGVLAAWLAAGNSLDDTVQAANVAAALSVTRAGARGGMPTRAQIELTLSG
ncbi:MAG: ribokinase [Chloroflexota bacterium]|nr:ribokinase [Chloroflexota bacterium]